MNAQGLIWGLVSYALWGFFPVYWKLLSNHSPAEILVHRMLWAFVFYLIVFLIVSRSKLFQIFKQTRRDWMLSITACLLLTFNWGIYIFAVNTGHILDGSLAYFINPILNVAVGVIFFRESFSVVLRIAVAAAALGVGFKIFSSTGFPWISLSLAFSFCAYGITKKLSRIPATTSSALEGFVGVIPAIAGVTYFTSSGGFISGRDWALFVGGGVVTGLPLFLFSFAAQRVPYSVLGMLQFLAPSLQFLVAIFLYGEVLTQNDVVTFGLIWVGILFYFTHQFWSFTSHKRA